MKHLDLAGLTAWHAKTRKTIAFTTGNWTLSGDWYIFSVSTVAHGLGANFTIDVYVLSDGVYIKAHGHYVPPDWWIEVDASGNITLKTTAAFAGKIILMR